MAAGTLAGGFKIVMGGVSDARSIQYIGSDKMDKNKYGGGNTDVMSIRSGHS